MFQQVGTGQVISTRGLKEDAVKYGELVFDVNSAYFYNHGGYEFANNRAMSEALGEDVYHYHLHVVYIRVVEKQILWSKR